MKTTQLRAAAMAFACTVLLSACGGGDDGSAAATGNSVATTPISGSSNNNGNDTTASTGGNDTTGSAPVSNVKLADTSNHYGNVKTAYAALDAYANYAVPAYELFLSSMLNAVPIDPTAVDYSCSQSGTATLAIDDADHSQTISPGDTVAVTFDHCVDASSSQVYVSGTLTYQVKEQSHGGSNGTDLHALVDATADQLAVVTPDGTQGLLNGTIEFQQDVGGSGTSNQTSVAALTTQRLTYVSTSTSGNVIRIATDGLQIKGTFDPTDGEQITVSGPLNVTFNQDASQLYLTVATPTPLDVFTSSQEPTKGTITLASGTELVSASYASEVVDGNLTGNSVMTISGAAGLSTTTEALAALLTQ